MKTQLVRGAAVLALAGLAVAAAVHPPGVAAGSPTTRAAEAVLAALSADQRAGATAAFDGPARKDWKFVPADRAGVMLGSMTDTQRAAVRALLRSVLSSQGILKAEAIIAMESVLREMEKGNPARDPARYFLMIFGTPGDAHGWGWRFEGHHLSLNVTLLGGEVLSVTPMFLGSNPGTVRSGPLAGLRVLGEEEDLGRELVTSLTPEQRAQAVIAAEAPADVLLVPGRPVDGLWPSKPVGVAVSAMSAEQRALCDRLIEEYARVLRGPLADAELARIRKDLGEVRFCWAGPLDPGKGHYYRLVGPSFAVEYDNTQNDANHIHTLWHDRTRDFGGDPLRDHVTGR